MIKQYMAIPQISGGYVHELFPRVLALVNELTAEDLSQSLPQPVVEILDHQSHYRGDSSYNYSPRLLTNEKIPHIEVGSYSHTFSYMPPEGRSESGNLFVFYAPLLESSVMAYFSGNYREWETAPARYLDDPDVPSASEQSARLEGVYAVPENVPADLEALISQLEEASRKV